MRNIKVLTYNIHKGFRAGNVAFILERIRRELHQLDPDVVFLQEVLGHHEKPSRRIRDWSTTAQFEYLAHGKWDHVHYGKNVVYEHGHHGNAILSKHPLRLVSNVNVSTNRLESRGILHVVMNMGVDIHLMCTHLGLWERSRKAQLRMLSDLVRETVPAEAPLLVAGDFNDWRHSATPILRETLGLTEAFVHMHGRAPRTFPALIPSLSLDRIYSRGITPVRAVCHQAAAWKALSDHLPLEVEFGLQ